MLSNSFLTTANSLNYSRSVFRTTTQDGRGDHQLITNSFYPSHPTVVATVVGWLEQPEPTVDQPQSGRYWSRVEPDKITFSDLVSSHIASIRPPRFFEAPVVQPQDVTRLRAEKCLRNFLAGKAQQSEDYVKRYMADCEAFDGDYLFQLSLVVLLRYCFYCEGFCG